MSTSGEAADQMAREALQFSEVAIKLTALGFKNSLALALAYAKENPKVKGKTSLDRLLRENKELKVIPIKSEDVSKFKEYAKQYGVLFAVVKDKTQSEKVDIMFKAEDVSKLNRIYEQMGYAIPKPQNQGNRKKRSPAIRKGQNRGRKRKALWRMISVPRCGEKLTTTAPQPRRCLRPKRYCRKKPLKPEQRRPDDVRYRFQY